MSSTTGSEFDEHPSVIAERYQVERILGRGGMAVVYQVRDIRSDKPVALKQLLLDKRSNQIRKVVSRLFEQEFYTLAQLTHPGVIEVYDFGKDGDRPYYTMELLDGSCLRDLAPLSWNKACSLLVEVCSALSLLHSRRQVHRDISPNNIHCNKDGRAKLIDFGAMAPVGPCRRVIGTPAYASPEVVGLQLLDAQSDLYSLGATLYYVLTRHNAYPARRFMELHSLWETQPLAPSKYVADIPNDLDDLVLSLIQVDPMARPASMAEVMEKLSAIAGLELDERLLVSQSYLSTPTLVGRDEQLLRLRKRLTRASNGQGNALIIQGESGVGRSRFLDNCILEARLGGASVLRADASDAYGGNWSVVRAIASQLMDALPAVALAAAEPHLPTLSLVLPELLGKSNPVHSADGSSDALLWRPSPIEGRLRMPPGSFLGAQALRPRIQAALRDWFLTIGTEHYLILALDDIHRIDEPSAAFVALLSNEISQKKILIAVTADTSASSSSQESIELLKEIGTKIRLGNLSVAHTESLLKSIFGQDSRLRIVADRIQAVSGGNPLAVMRLAQHLVDNKTIRYQAGTWLVPPNFDSGDIPGSLVDAFRARIERLGAASFKLAQTMALSPEHSFTREECLMLTEHRKMDQLTQNLDEVIASEIVSTDAKQYWLTQRAWILVLLDEVDEQTQRDCHRRLAEVFEKRENEQFRAAQHWLLAGKEGRALDDFVSFSETTAVLTAEDPAAYSDLLQSLPDDWQYTLGTAIDLARQKRRPQRQIFALQSRLSGLSAIPGSADPQHLREILKRLAQDSGLARYYELDDSMDSTERLRLSLEFAQQRYDSSPESERVLAPGDSIRELSRSLIQAMGVVYSSLDSSLSRVLPSLAPLVDLSPALGIVEKLIQATKAGTAGRIERLYQLDHEIFDRVNQPDRSGLNQTHHEFIRYGVVHSLGLLEAIMGIPSALNWTTKFEASPLFQVDAQLIRMLYYLWQGDSKEAEECRQRAEVLRIQNGAPRAYRGAIEYVQLLAYCLSDDLLGVKQVLGQIEDIARMYPGWVPTLHYANGEYQRIRGNLKSALDELKYALKKTAPGQYRGWPSIAGAYLKTLHALKRYDKAQSEGRELLEAAKEADLGYSCHYLGMPLALAEAQSGDYENALRISEAAIDGFKTLGSTGLNLGLAYETRAYLAVQMGDYDTFKTYAELLAVEYKVGANRALSVKHAKLLEKGRRKSGISNTPMLKNIDSFSIHDAKSMNELTGILLSSNGYQKRAENALEILVKKSRALGGFLYFRQQRGLILVAENGDIPCTAEMDEAAHEYLRSEIDDSREVTMTLTQSEENSSSTDNSRWTFTQGEQYQPVLLSHLSEQGFVIVGLVVLRVDPNEQFIFPTEIATMISSILLEAGDIPSVL